MIERGDLLHVDFGVRSSGIVADQQKMAYVLRSGDTAVPAGLATAFTRSTRMADILRGALTVGRTGIEIETAAESRAADEGIDALVYSHVQDALVHGDGRVSSICPGRSRSCGSSSDIVEASRAPVARPTDGEVAERLKAAVC